MRVKDFWQGRRSSSPAISDALRAELESPIPWMYEWPVAPDVVTRLAAPELTSVHETRREVIEPVVRDAIAAAGPNAAVLDLGCNEGWFAHQALEWGAERAVGVDVRGVNVRRAELLREHLGVPADRLQFHHASVFDLETEPLGSFDVVLVLGLIYHLENPIGALRIAAGAARGAVVVESQLTAHREALRVGWGETGVYKEVPGHWAAILEPAEEQAAEGNLLSSFGGVLSLVPNAPALVQAMEVIGLRDVRMLDVPDHLNPQYVNGDRGIAAGYART
jgi:SAM-dependent methyltransferase